MSQFHLQLRVDAPGSDGDRLAHALTEASQRVRASLYRRLGLKVHSNAWVTIALGSDAARRTVQAILEECRAGNVVAGSATVFERFDEAETAAADWFYVTTKTADGSFSLWDDYPSYAPGTVDEHHGPVPPMYTPDELAALRLEERRLFGARNTRPPISR